MLFSVEILAQFCGKSPFRPHNYLGLVLIFQRGALPMHHAAMKGYPEIMKMLISAGSKIDIPDKVSPCSSATDTPNHLQKITSFVNQRRKPDYLSSHQRRIVAGTNPNLSSSDKNKFMRLFFAEWMDTTNLCCLLGAVGSHGSFAETQSDGQPRQQGRVEHQKHLQSFHTFLPQTRNPSLKFNRCSFINSYSFISGILLRRMTEQLCMKFVGVNVGRKKSWLQSQVCW